MPDTDVVYHNLIQDLEATLTTSYWRPFEATFIREMVERMGRGETSLTDRDKMLINDFWERICIRS